MQGLADRLKRKQVFRHLREQKCDIYCIQETHSKKQTHKMWRSEWGGEIYFADGQSNAKGVMIMLHPKLKFDKTYVNKDEEGRFISLEIKQNDMKFTVINLYAPNADSQQAQSQYFKETFGKIEQINTDQLVIMGNLNIHLGIKKDKKGGSEKTTKVENFVKAYLAENNWVDCWRDLHGNEFQFTWKKRNPLVMSRLDYIIVPASTFNSVYECEIEPGFMTDHAFVKVHINSTTQIRGKGYWKFNVKLLRNPDYVEKGNTIIDTAKERDKLKNDGIKWENLKDNLEHFSKFYAKSVAVQEKEQKQNLTRKLKSPEKKLAMINLKASNAIKMIEKINEKIDPIKENLEKMSASAVQGAIMRSKVNWTQYGEHSSSYFLKLEKAKAKAKTMSTCTKENGQITIKSNEILQEQKNFYTKLYESNEKVQYRPININNQRKLTETQKKTLEAEITMEELQNAVKEMAKNKSPGTDGFQIDIYIVFWRKIKEVLLAAIKYSQQCKRLTPSMRKGIISLLPKTGRDTKKVANWRPITLLNSDYKIYAKIIANRPKMVLDDIVHPDQTGFIAGRVITENIRRIFDIMEYTYKAQIPVVIISIDFEKAFDRVEYKVLYQVLKWFNFGNNFIDMVKLLFTDMSLRVINNGYFSDNIMPMRGLFQGNPAASSLFVIMIETLAIQLRANPKIEGININGKQNLLAQFADDLALFLKFKQNCWNEVVNVFQKFEGETGMKINYNKSVVYRIGSLRHTWAKFYTKSSIQWSNEPMKILGIFIDHSTENIIKLNIEPIIEKAESILNMWMMQKISLLGKILVINALVASLFVYRLAVIPALPDKYVKKIKQIFKHFIWEGKKPK